jgi:hypothetical protein
MGVDLATFRQRIGVFIMQAMKVKASKHVFKPYTNGTRIHFKAMTYFLV